MGHGPCAAAVRAAGILVSCAGGVGDQHGVPSFCQEWWGDNFSKASGQMVHSLFQGSLGTILHSILWILCTLSLLLGDWVPHPIPAGWGVGHSLPCLSQRVWGHVHLEQEKGRHREFSLCQKWLSPLHSTMGVEVLLPTGLKGGGQV